MDLVGPRPHPVSNYELFTRSTPYYSLRSLVRPGLTGWAEVRNGYAQNLAGHVESEHSRSTLRNDGARRMTPRSYRTREASLRKLPPGACTPHGRSPLSKPRPLPGRLDLVEPSDMSPVLLTLILCLLVLPTAANAQRVGGYYVTPFLRIGGEYDDNVFGAPSNIETDPGREGDYSGSASPGVTVGYFSEPFSLYTGYSTTARVYARQSGLDNPFDEQSAPLHMRYRQPRFSLDVDAGYFETHYADTLNPVPLSPAVGTPQAAAPPPQPGEPQFGDVAIPVEPTTVETTNLNRGRGRATSYVAQTLARYELTPLTTGALHSRYVHTDQVGGTSNDAIEGGGSLYRTLGPLDSASLSYYFSAFGFGSQGLGQGSGTTSHSVSAGYIRRLTDRLSMRLSAGPRFSGGSVNANALAAFGYLLQDGGASLSYNRAQAVVVGEQGVFETDTLALGLYRQLGRFLKATLGVGVTRADRDTSDAWVYHVTFGTGYPLSESVTASLFYRFSYTDQTFSTGSPREKIYHNIVSIGLSTGATYRVL
jgi:Bacterial sugar transferase